MASGFNLGSAFIRIIADTSGLRHDITSGLRGIDTDAGRAGDQVGSSLRTHISNSVSGVSSVVTSAAKVGVFGLVGLGAAATVMGVKTAAANQQAEISFTSLLGSSSKAHAYLQQLTQFAAVTPFDLPGVEKAAQQLLGVGINAKGVIPFLTAFGNTASALGLQTDQFNSVMTQTTQAIANGKFQIGDLSALASNGIPVYKLLGEAFHKSSAQIGEMATKGQLTATKVLPALQSQMNKDYGGAMAKQSQTLTGLWSTLTDTISQSLAKAIQPLIPYLQKYLPQAINVASTAIGLFGSGFKIAIQFFTQDVLPVIQKLWTNISAAFQGSGGISGIFQSFQSVVSSVIAAVKPGIAALITAFAGILPKLMPIVAGFVQAFKAAAPVVAQIISAIAGIIASLLPKILPVLKQLEQAFAAFVELVRVFWARFGGIITTFTKNYLATFITIIGGALKIVTGIIKLFSDLLQGRWGKLWGDIKLILSGVWEIIKGLIARGVATIVAVFQVGLKLITSIFGGAWRTVIGGVSSAMSTAYHAVTGFIGNVVGAIRGLPGKISSFAGSMLSAGSRLMSSMGRGILNGIKSVGGTISNFAGDVWNGIKGLINADFIDPIRNFSFSIGVPGFHHTFQPFGGLPELATGGWVSGAGTGTSDSIPAMLSNGEFVVNARAAAQNAGLLQAINNGVHQKPATAQVSTTAGDVFNMNGNIIISADDVKGFNDAIDFFRSFKRVARAGV